MARPLALALALILLLAPAPVIGQGRHAARDLAAACAGCHGSNGASVQGMPYLAGQSRAYIVERMHEYRTGKRPSTVMHQIARGYTDEQIEAMAAYFSAQKAR
jgi:cytochrome subunit of sulfide dehydrogenase